MDKQSNIAIIGFGDEGKSVLNYLTDHGYLNVTVCDQNVEIKETMPEGVSVRLGEHYMEDLLDFNVIFRSPGIKYLDPQIQSAVKNGVEITSSTAFFLDQSPGHVIGVTGTKGKGTCSTLIYEMLKKSYKKVYIGGNIGIPAISFLDDLKGNDLVVLELSSFQLQDVQKSPHYAVLLNTTVDHLDYHADQDEYMSAKESLLANQHGGCVAVLNQDYPYVKYYEGLVKGKKLFVSVKDKVEDGAFIEDGEIFYAKYEDVEKICDVSDVALIGSHNLENVLPAIVIAKELLVPTEDIVSVIKSFKGLPHRLQETRTFNKVTYYNDSFSTTPLTSMAAVDSFEEPTVLIAGGYDKGADYGEWAVRILTKPSLHCVVLVGNTSAKMADEIEEAKSKLGEAEATPTKVLLAYDLKEAVTKAQKEAEGFGADAVVVMSPASSSFDLYHDYKERGKKFMEIVKGL